MVRKAGSLSLLLMVTLCGAAGAELIAYYPLNEGQGTKTADATGNGNDGTLSSGVEWVAGVKAGAVRFDTAGERIVTTGLNPTATNNAMTLAAWIKWEGRGNSISQQGIIGKRLGWNPGSIKWFWQTNPAGDLLFRADNGQGGTGLWWNNTRLVPYANEWTHVAVTWANGTAVQYVNAKETDRGTVALGGAVGDATPVTIGCVDSTNTETFVGSIDEVRIYDTALTVAELDKAMTGDTTSASAPQPVAGATDVPRDVLLSWAAGDSAASHDVYLGTDATAVDGASRTDKRGVLASQGQTETSYKIATPLEYGKTYYWRVDEVNAPPGSAVHKGGVWSFTVEPYAYALPGASITATASSSEKATTQPINTINGSGLSNDLHSSASDAMWVSSPTDPGPVWIRYQFDKVYKLQELWVWNHNTEMEPILGYGFKAVTIETSTDGTTWTVLKDVQFAQGTAQPGYAHNTTVDLGGVLARYVRLTAKSNWSIIGWKQYGLSEVRFSYVPTEARAPQPGHNAQGVSVDTTLDWRPGRDATSHKVVFGTDRAAVTAGTATSKSVTEHGFTPGALDFATTYYWKVDEAGTATYPGSVWGFTTQQFAVVDDFETYTDKTGAEVFTAWVDGFDNPAKNGAVVGLPTAAKGTFCDTTTFHGGKQSMPFAYDNSKALLSEAVRTFDTPQDWSAHAADTLVLYVQGRGPDFEVANAATPPVIDGKVDAVWANAAVLPIKTLINGAAVTGPADASGQFRALYDTANLYVLVDINDEALRNDSTATYLDDSVEVYIDGENLKGQPPLAGNARQYTFGWTDTAIGGTNTNTTGVQQVQTNTPTGWRIEIKLPWQSLLGAPAPVGKLIGIDCFYNDDDDGGDTRESQIAWHSKVGNDWQTPASWGTALVAAPGAGPSSDRVYVTVQDSSNGSATVTYPGPEIMRASWTEWRIPLSAFSSAGVKLTAVKKLTIGVGDKANPKAGGTGKLFIDDIQVGKIPASVGLVAAYSFENDVKDSSGQGYDGTVLGAPTFVAGRPGAGMALKLNGTTDCVDLGNWPVFNFPASFSLSVWANIGAWTSNWNHVMVGNRGENGIGWQLRRRDSNKICFTTRGVGQDDLGSTKDAPLNEWVHIAAVYDNAANTKRIYINGVEDAFAATTPGKLAATTHNTYIGCRANSANTGREGYFTGMLDEVKIYDTVLTPAEILALAAK